MLALSNNIILAKFTTNVAVLTKAAVAKRMMCVICEQRARGSILVVAIGGAKKTSSLEVYTSVKPFLSHLTSKPLFIGKFNETKTKVYCCCD